MRIALAVYIVVFGAAGAWSVIPDDPPASCILGRRSSPIAPAAQAVSTL
jgi:hypothetical protein